MSSEPPVATSASYDDLRRLAVETARAAGHLAREGRESELDVQTKSSAVDVVTAMDTAVEELIAQRLLAARPGDGILGEEGASDAGSSGVRWVVDPIDGTVNYLYRLPAWAVSIAAEVDGEVVAAAVYNPSTDEMFSATRDGGAHLDDEPITCSTVTTLDQALLATGFGYRAERRAAQARVVADLLPVVRDIRRFGAAAIDLCHVACGRVDAYYERGLKPWDLAAGGLIAREAGAVVSGLAGAPASEDMTVAAPPALWEPLHDRLVALDAARD